MKLARRPWLRLRAPPDSRAVRRLFLAALGAVYLIAFTSLRVQVRGLYGRRGIRPIADYLDALRARGVRVHRVPSIFWLGASDAALVRACTAGQIGSGLLALGVAPRPVAAALWALYLSFVSVGRELMSFQWDVLLLETGLHAVVVAPGLRRRRAADSPTREEVALMRWLVFRLYFQSGYCKLASGDPTWRDGTACVYHYETQPLPTPLSWYAHQLPRWFQRLSTYVAVGTELGAPFLAAAPRRLRRASFYILAGLQSLIAATGNYGFFNVLTLADSLWLLDDEALRAERRPRRRAPAWRRIVSDLAAAPLAALSEAQLLARLRQRTWIPRPLQRLEAAAAPFHSINPYGLFAVMTTRRPEIVLEGSRDGVEWREYGFRYKPGDLRRPPRWVAPHQPRLDWQMWFAALTFPPAWFAGFVARLLEGSPEVLALLGDNPFPDRPPTYVRALLYDYQMTDRETRRRTGACWQRELLGLYFPPCRL